MIIRWNRVYPEPSIESIVGKIPVKITVYDREGEIIIRFSDKTCCMFYHEQDCCESVWIEDVNGDWDDLIGHPLLVAECRQECPELSDPWSDSETWTFYTFRGIGGSVDVRWVGQSNGYYSESVNMLLGTYED